MTDEAVVTWINNDSTHVGSINEYMLSSYKYADKYIEVWSSHHSNAACIDDSFVRQVAIETIKEVQTSWHKSQ